MSREKVTTCFDLCSLSLQPRANSHVHFTENYSWQSNRKLVARRGFPIQFSMTGTQDFEADTHRIVFQFDLDNGNACKTSRETHRQIKLDTQISELNEMETKDWSAEVLKVDENLVTAQLFIPCTEIIGCWRIKVRVGLQTNDQLRESYVTSQQRIKIYLICNPFHTEDDTYVEQRSLRDYYLNQEVDLWFSATAVGTSNKYNFRKEPWIHSQFEENSMKTVMLLLERLSFWHGQRFRGGLSYSDRRCVARIARKLSFAINYVLLNTHDESDQASLSSSSLDNRPSNDWLSTSEIIDEFIQTRQPVSCSTSHTYANVFVSLLRCIGVCSRASTCVESAYDTDVSLTVDRAYFRESETLAFTPMKRNENFEWESTWNYHIWTELFIKRPDLSTNDYNGWQAVDSTPQENSFNISQCGPAPVKAIREGRLDMSYDCWFFYGQLNADVMKWFYEKDTQTNEYRLLKADFQQKSEGIGRAVLTTNPRAFGYPLDLTNEYKDGTSPNYSTYTMKLNGLMDRQERVKLLYNNKSLDSPNSDVHFLVKEIGWVVYGEDINVQVEFNNKASTTRCINFSVRVHIQTPNGRLIRQINNFQDRIELKPFESESLKLFTPIADYSRHTTTHKSLIAIASAAVESTGQLFYHEEKFQLFGSSIEIIAPSFGEVNEPLLGLVTVKNPLSETLTNVELLLHSGKIEQATRIDRFPREIHPGQRAKVHIRFRPIQAGNRLLMAVVNSSQIQNLSAIHLFKAVQQPLLTPNSYSHNPLITLS